MTESNNITDPTPDFLTPLARRIWRERPDAYQKLIAPRKTPAEAHALLDGVTVEQLLTPRIDSYGFAYAVLAGLWLWHDGLHECHEIAQADPEALHGMALNSASVGSAPSPKIDKDRMSREMAQALPTFSFWHAIMHRREGDFSNAKYWYARCADHRAYRLISALATDAVGRETTDVQLLHVVGGEFNGEAFVDLVAAVAQTPEDPRYAAAVRLQQIEWEALFQYCIYEAVGAEGGMV